MKVVPNKVTEGIKRENPKFLIVTATTYTVDKDDTIQSYTASGFKINEENPKEHRIIAISWDLRKMFKFGEKVLVEGIGKYSGIYTVRDLMASRWKKRIDILRNPEDLLITYHKVKISKIK
jgi:3D (Asp-Asp-Asp) domain-containing protein